MLSWRQLLFDKFHNARRDDRCRCLFKLPFGEEVGAGVGGRTETQGYVADNVRQKFTGYERDGETGLDFAQARYYSNVQGRFTSVDPLDGVLTTPQSWNKYTYCLNNPLVFVDPTGLRWAQRVGSDGNVSAYEWFDDKADDNGNSAYSNALNNGWSAATFDESQSFTYTFQGGDADLYNRYQLNPNGTHGCISCANVDMMPGQVLDAAIGGAIGRGLLNIAGRILGPVSASIFGRGVGEVAETSAGVTNPIPSTAARVISGEGPFTTLGRPGADDVFITAADDIVGMNASQLSNRLTIPQSNTFTVIEFSTPLQGLASPINRTYPSFAGFGRTAGGAREFVIPNGPVPANAKVRVVK